MALTLIVGGLVTSYIVFTVKFNQRTEAAYERDEQFTALREEITSWFSFADSSDYDIIIAEDGGVSVSSGTGEDSSITYSDGTVTFIYPIVNGIKKDAKTITCDYVTDIKFYKYDNPQSAAAETSESGELRFTIQTKISGGLYACEIFCK